MGTAPRPARPPGGADRARAGGGSVLARRSRQVQLRLLAGCDVEVMDDGQAHSVGALAARAGTTDIIDAGVDEGALRRHDLVVSSDPDDLRSIASATGHRLEIDHP
jgi:hypothetical protein